MDNGSQTNNINNKLWVVEVITICIGIFLCIHLFTYLQSIEKLWTDNIWSIVCFLMAISFGIILNYFRIQNTGKKYGNYSGIRTVYNFIFDNTNREMFFYLIILYFSTLGLITTYQSDQERENKYKQENRNTNEDKSTNSQSYWHLKRELPNNNYVIYIAFVLGLLGFFFSIQGKVEAHDAKTEAHDAKIASEKALQALENVKEFNSIFEDKEAGFYKLIEYLDIYGKYKDVNPNIILFIGFPIIGFFHKEAKIQENAIIAFREFTKKLENTNKNIQIFVFKEEESKLKLSNFYKENPEIRHKEENIMELIDGFYKKFNTKINTKINTTFQEGENLRFYTIKNITDREPIGAFWIVRDSPEKGFTSNVVYTTNNALINTLNNAIESIS